MNHIPEVTACMKRGLVCPIGTICGEVNGNYDCACNKGYEMIVLGEHKTCQGRK